MNEFKKIFNLVLPALNDKKSGFSLLIYNKTRNQTKYKNSLTTNNLPTNWLTDWLTDYVTRSVS